jgi:hypothetical protein
MQGGAAGGIQGVVSKSKEASIRIYQGQGYYNRWFFRHAGGASTPGGVGSPMPGGGGRSMRPGPGPGRGIGPPGRGSPGRGGPGPGGPGPGRPGRGGFPPGGRGGPDF